VKGGGGGGGGVIGNCHEYYLIEQISYPKVKGIKLGRVIIDMKCKFGITQHKIKR
jgi:hypothetical protein